MIAAIGPDRRCEPDPAPRQRNTQDEKKAIKDGRTPDDWKDKPAKLRQKDRDARWTVKYTKAKPREDGSLFVLYADRKLLTPEMIARIEAQFHLPQERTEVKSDFHYQSKEIPNGTSTRSA